LKEYKRRQEEEARKKAEEQAAREAAAEHGDRLASCVKKKKKINKNAIFFIFSFVPSQPESKYLDLRSLNSFQCVKEKALSDFLNENFRN